MLVKCPVFFLPVFLGAVEIINLNSLKQFSELSEKEKGMRGKRGNIEPALVFLNNMLISQESTEAILKVSRSS